MKETESLKSLFDFIRTDLFSNTKIVPITDIVTKLTSLLNSLSVHEICTSTKKNLRRKLEAEFGDSLTFFIKNRQLFLMPNTLTKEEIAKKYAKMKSSLETHEENNNNVIIQAATSLRQEMKSSLFKNNWPSLPAELTPDYITIPQNLKSFLHVLFNGSENVSARADRLAWSIAQDIITAVTSSTVKTPKHILLPWAVKTLTGNVEVIKILNRLGHGCSYSVLEEIETALCINKVDSVERDSVPLPVDIHISVPTVLAFDNIDRLEETLSGGGTSRRVNGIIIQPKSASCMPPPIKTMVMKTDKIRSLKSSHQLLPLCTLGKREGPPAVQMLDLCKHHNDQYFEALRKNHLWLTPRLIETSEQKS